MAASSIRLFLATALCLLVVCSAQFSLNLGYPVGGGYQSGYGNYPPYYGNGYQQPYGYGPQGGYGRPGQFGGYNNYGYGK